MITLSILVSALVPGVLGPLEAFQRLIGNIVKSSYNVLSRGSKCMD